MKKYTVEITYTRTGYLEVEEDSEEDAMAKVQSMDMEDIFASVCFDPDDDEIEVNDAELEEE